MVREFGFMTLRTGNQAGKSEFEMGPAFVPPGLRNFMFWISHTVIYLRISLALSSMPRRGVYARICF